MPCWRAWAWGEARISEVEVTHPQTAVQGQKRAGMMLMVRDRPFRFGLVINRYFRFVV